MNGLHCFMFGVSVKLFFFSRVVELQKVVIIVFFSDDTVDPGKLIARKVSVIYNFTFTNIRAKSVSRGPYYATS